MFVTMPGIGSLLVSLKVFGKRVFMSHAASWRSHSDIIPAHRLLFLPQVLGLIEKSYVPKV